MPCDSNINRRELLFMMIDEYFFGGIIFMSTLLIIAFSINALL
ncbi:MAG: hypothetical protein ABFD04_09815 [Syntrophomonas sp.]